MHRKSFGQRSSSHGFSLIEVVVVVLVVGSLAILVVIAVHAARDAARRAQCVNNLKQIGLALHNYHAAVGLFPSAYSTQLRNGSPISEAGGNWGWGTMILAYLDQGPLFNAVNFGRILYDSEVDTVRRTGLGVFLCPSSEDLGPVHIMQWGGTDPVVDDLAPANYVASAGRRAIGRSPHSPDWSAFTRNSEEDGAMYANSAVGLSAVLDGASSTLLVGERSRNLADSTWVGTTPITDGQICTRAGNPTQECVATNVLVMSHTSPENGGRVPIWVDCPNYPAAGADGYWSRHAGGCNFLFCDGSVRFVKSGIDPRVFSALSTRAGQEVVNLE
jgi:prepilin-type processing-associated H-X9-DG protein/prepilin-type N-terminal cleavage/methylation domain-containing protein